MIRTRSIPQVSTSYAVLWIIIPASLQLQLAAAILTSTQVDNLEPWVDKAINHYKADPFRDTQRSVMIHSLFSSACVLESASCC